MTLDELRDWHAKRAGWTQKIEGDFEDAKWCLHHHSQWDHPYPETIDGAARAFQCNELEGWTWFRVGAFQAVTQWEALGLDRMTSVEVEDTGNEIFDRYLLAKKCLEEQEAAR